jgi:transcriptional regulator with XRE-family HTH domain
MKEVTTAHRRKIGVQFREYREAEGWSVEQVAEMADVKPATIEKIEAGAFNVPLDILTRVSDVLGCELAIKSKDL